MVILLLPLKDISSPKCSLILVNCQSAVAQLAPLFKIKNGCDLIELTTAMQVQCAPLTMK